MSTKTLIPPKSGTEAKVLLAEIRQYFGQIGLDEVSPELEAAWEQYRQAYLQPRPQA